MKCQNLFSGKNKKNIISLLSAELAQRVAKINMRSLCLFLGPNSLTGIAVNKTLDQSLMPS